MFGCLSRRAAGFRKADKQRRVLLRLDVLEDRVLPSLSPHLLKDLNLRTADSAPGQFLAIGGVTYFSASDGIHGVELWRTNGTAAGTAMLKDINPGSGN